MRMRLCKYICSNNCKNNYSLSKKKKKHCKKNYYFIVLVGESAVIDKFYNFEYDVFQ